MNDAQPRRIGRYTVLRPLGEGGMGEVFEATLNGPSGFRKRVAIKRIRRDRPDLDHTLLHEARLGALLSHPNVVSTLDLQQTDEGWVIAMELVQGPSLWAFRHQGPISAVAVVDVGVQVAVALSHVHELTVSGQPVGLVHRDVKPSNLLLDGNGLVKLADLGLAALGDATDGQMVGTPGFAAPEQIDGRSDPRSDLFALGAVLLWLATGQLPFGEGLPANDKVRDCDGHLERSGLLGPVRAQVPELADVIARCLRADPEERYPSARHLVAALQLLRPHCPDGHSLAETLAERTGVEHIGLQVTPAGSPAPPLPTNLPDADGSLVGRDADCEQLVRNLLQTRAVGLFGPPGVGKSAVAKQVGRLCLPQFPGGVWHVDLSDTEDEATICSAIGLVLGVPLASADAAAQLGSALAARGATLLVLDHTERVLTPLDRVVQQIATRAPKLRLLVCGRRRVEVVGHQALLGPLSSADSLTLFRQRRGRTADPEEEDVERSLVATLDGLPLSIELAAARASFLPLDQVLARLTDRFRLLGSETEGRHSTLRTALDLSWNQLSRPLRKALSQLGVFRGGFTLDAATAVLDVGHASPWSLQLLHQLSEHSLLQVDPVNGRFHLLGVVRDYVLEQLSDGERRLAERRHGAHYAHLDHQFGFRRDGPRPIGELIEFDQERSNLTVAALRAVQRGDAAIATANAVCAAQAYRTSGPVSRARPLLDAVLGLDTLSTAQEAVIRTHLASVCVDLGDHAAARAHAEQAVSLARAAEDAILLASTLKCLGTTLRYSGDPHAGLIHLEESRGLAARSGHRVLHARALSDLGMTNAAVGRLDDAHACLVAALGLMRAAASPRDEQIALNSLGIVLAKRGEPAMETFRRAVALSEKLGDEATEGRTRQNLASQLLGLGHIERAIRHQRRAVEIVGRHGTVPIWITACGNLGAMFVEAGQPDQARTVLQQALSVAQSSGLQANASTVHANLGRLAILEEDTARAIAHFKEAIRIEHAAGEVSLVQRCTLLLGMAHRYDGDLDPALRYATAVYNWAVRNEPLLAANALVELARIRVAQRQGPEALRLANNALQTLDTDPLTPPGLLALGVKAAAMLTCGQRDEGEAELVRAELRARELQLSQHSAIGRQLSRIRNAFT
ncbi:MAG: tetratricopeptide repeat protein [Myxococcales bacterium]|nr:tetratricopeptide repeat protein [Myxococcales bacterium]